MLTLMQNDEGQADPVGVYGNMSVPENTMNDRMDEQQGDRNVPQWDSERQEDIQVGVDSEHESDGVDTSTDPGEESGREPTDDEEFLALHDMYSDA